MEHKKIIDMFGTYQYDVAQLVLCSIIFRVTFLPRCHGDSAGDMCDSMDHGLEGYLS